MRFNKEFGKFKKEILSKVNYEREENMNYCDFHCFFQIKITQAGNRIPAMLGPLVVKAVFKNDCFFLTYLRNFQN